MQKLENILCFLVPWNRANIKMLVCCVVNVDLEKTVDREAAAMDA